MKDLRGFYRCELDDGDDDCKHEVIRWELVTYGTFYAATGFDGWDSHYEVVSYDCTCGHQSRT